MLIPENDIPEHGVIVRLLPPLPQLVKAAAGPVLWRGGEENLYIRAGEDHRADVPAVHDHVPLSGRSRSYIANMVRLLKLCDSVQKDLIEGDLTVGQARPLLALRSAAQQMEAAERIKEGELSARQAETLVKSMQNKSFKAKTGKPQNTAEVRALMDRLKLSLGSPVNIKFRAGKKVQGKIEIAFSSEAELERLIAYMDGQDQTEDAETIEFRV